MKRISIIITSLLTLSLASCLKDRPNTDFTSTQGTYIAEITTASTNGTPNAPSAGVGGYFGGSTLSFIGVTGQVQVWFTVNIASDYPPKKDIPITLAIDPKALAAYNATGPATAFEQFPDSTYKIPTLTGTIKAGQRLDTFYVTFDADKIDPTHSYMLPLSITTAPGTTISGNFGTIYFHVIGNPLAGSYNWEFTRWNSTDSSGTNSGHIVDVQPFIPVTPTNIEVQTGYYTAPRYELTFDNNNGVLSNFAVTFNKDDVQAMFDYAGAGVSVLTAPKIIIADPVHGIFEFYWQASTSSGPRTVIDKFTK